jgi:hypothetical protein
MKQSHSREADFAQLYKKFLVVYVTNSFITMFTRGSHCSVYREENACREMCASATVLTHSRHFVTLPQNYDTYGKGVIGINCMFRLYLQIFLIFLIPITCTRDASRNESKMLVMVVWFLTKSIMYQYITAELLQYLIS